MILSLSCLVTLSYSLSHSISGAGFHKFVVRDDVISPAGVRNFGTYDDVFEQKKGRTSKKKFLKRSNIITVDNIPDYGIKKKACYNRGVYTWQERKKKKFRDEHASRTYTSKRKLQLGRLSPGAILPPQKKKKLCSGTMKM